MNNPSVKRHLPINAPITLTRPPACQWVRTHVFVAYREQNRFRQYRR
ncbi:hypothetical protein [Nitrosomonas ureae]|nr:hypothetical protein [Nitrosomonas ureae]